MRGLRAHRVSWKSAMSIFFLNLQTVGKGETTYRDGYNANATVEISKSGCHSDLGAISTKFVQQFSAARSSVCVNSQPIRTSDKTAVFHCINIIIIFPVRSYRARRVRFHNSQ